MEFLKWRKLGVYFFMGILFFGFSSEAFAVLDNSNVLTTVTDRFYQISSSWGTIILGYASSLFWSLALISLAWTGGIMVLQKADIQEIFIELIRFMMTTGFFFWFLQNGPVFAKSIIDSLRTIGGTAMGAGLTAPSGVLDLGFLLIDKTLTAATITHPFVAAASLFFAGAIFVLLSIVAVNLTVQFCAAWVLLYGGCIVLGFGGSRWTNDIAIQYYKTVFGLGLSLMTMILLIGVADSILQQFITQMSGNIEIHELAVVFVVVLILFSLITKLPALVGGMVSHGLIHAGIGNFGAGEAYTSAQFSARAAGIGFRELAKGGEGLWWLGGKAGQGIGNVYNRAKGYRSRGVT
jgi:P-type conjugative transfer protein TrbL